MVCTSTTSPGTTFGRNITLPSGAFAMVFPLAPASKTSIWVKICFLVLFDRYKKGLIVSSPATGQDPKTVTPSNIESASRHAGRQWGDNEGSEWLAYGAFNLIFYPNGEMVLEPVDIEHRIVGLFGFLMGIIPIKSDDVLYFDFFLFYYKQKNLPKINLEGFRFYIKS